MGQQKLHESQQQEYDIAVIGAGVVGAACAYHLSHQAPSMSIALFEQGDIPNPAASSHGDSRFFREMYSDPFYSKLMTSSLDLWHELEQHADKPLLTRNGVLFFGASDTGETAEGSIPGCRATMDALGMPYDLVEGPAALESRFPGLHAQPGDVGLFSHSDGSIDATSSCSLMSRVATERGATVVKNATLLRVERVSDAKEKFRLFFSDGRTVLVLSKLIICTGAWTTRILRDNFAVEFNASLKMVAWGHFELPDSAPDLPQWFAFRRRSHTSLPMPADDHGLYYGFPAVPAGHGCGTRRMVKVGIDFMPYCVDSNERELDKRHRTVPQPLVDDICGFVREHWPTVGRLVDLQLSPYHVTPSQDFVLGPVPGCPDVLTFCGASGRAFKFGPLLGACLADLALGRPARVDISRFDPMRVMKGPARSDNSGTVKRGSGMLGKSHVPFGDQGQGVYSMATQGCFDVLEASAALVKDAIDKIMDEEEKQASASFKQTQRAMALADFGAADGGTSLNLWTDLLAHVHAREPTCEIDLRYEDQPNADFQSLFAYTQGRLRVAGRSKPTFLEGAHGGQVFVSAIGTSFHSQCMPSGTLHLGISSTAMHWLSQRPKLNLPPGAVHHTAVPKESEVAAAWGAQADADWEAILLARARELRVGGRLVVANFCIDGRGQYLGCTEGVPCSMYDEMRAQWRRLHESGRISRAEFECAAIVNYYRSEEEMCSPLQSKESPVFRAGLRLEHVHTAVTPCPYRAHWLASGGDAKEYAKLLVMTMRTWSNSSFESALNSSRDSMDRAAVCDELYGGMEKIIASNPDDFGMDYVHAFLVIRKE